MHDILKSYNVQVVTRDGATINGTMQWDGIADIMAVDPTDGTGTRYVSSLDRFERREPIEARAWDSERRDSPYSTVADVEDEYCDACGDADTCDDCTELRVGTRVAYEDMANPRREGRVVEIIQTGGTTPSGFALPTGTEYRVRWDDPNDGETTSDMRQRGWSRA